MDESKFLSKIEARLDEWVARFEDKPISVGIKVIIVVLLLRWMWKSFK